MSKDKVPIPNYQIITLCGGCIDDTHFFNTKKEVKDFEKKLEDQGYVYEDSNMNDLSYITYNYTQNGES
jgi:hypothetical protein